MKLRNHLLLLFFLFPFSYTFALTEKEKQDTVLEFKKKLFKEEKLRKEVANKNNKTDDVLDDEDFEVLLEDDPVEQTEKKNKKNKKETELKDSLKKNSKESYNAKKTKEKSENDNFKSDVGGTNKQSKTNIIVKEDEKKQQVVENKKVLETTIKTDSEVKSPKEKETKVFNKLYNITDTGVSEEFLYSDEYKKLLTNTTNLQRNDLDKEEDIPILYAYEKNILDYNTTDIPEEILDYKRTEENHNIPNIISDEDMRSIAKKAILENNFAVFRGVIEQVGDPDYMIDESRSAFVFCIENGNYSFVKYLVYSGVSISKADSEGNTPLHIAVKSNNIEMIKLLIESGADFDIQNNIGNTPLMLALDEGLDSIVLFLIKNGASIELKNIDGETPYSLSVKYKKRKIQQCIMDVLRNGRSEDEL